jgi:hypothetical protein
MNTLLIEYLRQVRNDEDYFYSLGS